MVKVLLADDDFTLVSLLTTLLGMEGFKASSLMNKKGDLLENIRNENPDVLLIDYYLGDLNGLDIVRQIRLDPDLSGLYVIMVSGIDKTGDCLAAGANDFLLKPYMPEELFQKLRQVLTRTDD
jgi:two-component system phosphate regulon response regulator PhoB